MKSFAATLLASFAVADTLIQSGVGADQQDAALSAVFMGMPGTVSGAVLGNDMDATANTAAVALNDWFLGNANDMPRVCPDGEECRNKISQTTVTTIEAQWKTTLTEINSIFDKSFTRSQAILETAYDQARQCEPGCMCDRISVEYADIVRQQKIITEEVLVLTTKETELHTSQNGYLVTCPEYEYIHLTGDEVVAVYDKGSFTTEEVLSTNVEETTELLDSSANQTAETFVMTGTEDVGTKVTESENVVGADEGDWQTVDQSVTETTQVIDQEMAIPEAGYQ